MRTRPTSLDAEVTRGLLGALTGTAPWDAHAMHCLEEALSYAAGVMCPPGVAHMPMTQAQIDTALDTLSNDPGMQQLMAATSLNLMALLKAIFKLLEKLMGGGGVVFPQFPP